MFGQTLEGFVRAILTHHPERVGLEPPRMRPREYDQLARHILRHGMDPFAHPADLAVGEAFRLWRADLPRRCGAHVSGDLYIPKGCPAEDEGLIITHERSHGWLVRRGEDANEADAWWLTVHLALPIRLLGELNPHMAPWFQALCEESHDSITFVMIDA